MLFRPAAPRRTRASSWPRSARLTLITALVLGWPSGAAAQGEVDELDAAVPAPEAADPLLVRLSLVTGAFVTRHRAHLDVQTGHLASEQSAYFDVRVVPQECYSFVAVGDDGLIDLDLHVFGGGVEVAADTAIDNQPVAHWCNDAFERVSVEVRAYSGTGRYVFQILASDGEPGGLQGQLRAALDALAGRFAEGYRPALAPRAGVLATHSEERLELELAGGRSYVITAVGAATVTDLDLVLLDGYGRLELDADLASHAEPVIRYRVPANAGGRYLLRVVMVEGYGEYLIGVYTN